MNPILPGLTACLLLCARVVAAEAASQPDILFILADDLGYGDVHCLNPERGKIKTPNLDRLTQMLEKYVAEGRSTPGVAEHNESTVDITNEESGPATLGVG